MPLRDYRIHRYVNAFCPRCHEEDPDRELSGVARLSGWLAVRDGRVWLERGCPEHGMISTLYDESAEILSYLEQWTAPTKAHGPDTLGNFKPVPAAYADGLPEMQTQHTCILLEDLLDHCNLKCPTCFAESSPARASVAPLAQVLASIDARLSRENQRIDVLMLYDGESAEASTYHRGADIRRFKERAIERLSAKGIFMTLTMTAALGVNDDEIGLVIKRGLGTPYVGGVTIQPVFGSGRSGAIDPLDRLTHTGVLARLDEQTAGEVTWRDLTALPCSHPHCCSVGYLLRDDSGSWKSLVGLIGHDRLKQWLDLEPGLLANRIADDSIPDQLRAVVKGSLLDLLSEQSSLSHPSMASIWSDICTSCDLGIGTLATLAASKLPGQRERMRRLLGERVLRVTVKPFMDMNTMIEE